MMREVAEMMLFATSEAAGISIRCEFVIIFEFLDRTLEGNLPRILPLGRSSLLFG